MYKKTIVVLIILFSCLQMFAQIQWPVITQTVKPWTRWWWQGSAVDKKNLTIAMEKYKAAGLGGMEITPIYGVKGHEDKFIDYLSPRWVDMLQHSLQEGKRLGLGIDLANTAGWPFGGPWITPEDASKNINFKMYSVKGGEQLSEPVQFMQVPFYRSESRMQLDQKTFYYPISTNKNLQLYALDQLRYEMPLKLSELMAYGDKGEVLTLTDKVDNNGKLNWTAPAGNWKLCALFMGWHGKLVERAAPGGEGNVIDHFDRTALNHYLQKFDIALKGKDISGLRAYFNDSYEVDDARGQSNWSPLLLKEFQNRRKYDLRKYLPQLLGRDSTELGRRVLSDYRQTISELLLDNFTKAWKQWAVQHKKILRNQSHGSPANILDQYAAIDIPETEGVDILRFKFATSAAHVSGKPLASAEAATWLNEHFQSSLGDVKQTVDKYFVGGVNHIFWHGTNYSPQDEPWPGWLFYAAVHFTPANSFWRDFGTLNQYVARCQSFLQQGKHDNDILLYYPFSDRLAEMGRDLLLHFDGMEGFDKTVFKSDAESLLQKGYAFDLISDKQVLLLTNKGQELQSAGNHYKTIVISDVRFMPIETMQKLKQAAENGATVIFHKGLPTDIPGLSDYKQGREHLQKMSAGISWSDNADKTVLSAVIGKGSFLSGDNIEKLLLFAKLERETLTDKGLQYVRRRYAGGHYYFISNPGKTAIHEWVPITATEKNVGLFDPMNGNKGIAKTRITEGKVAVWLQLQPGQSCILQTGNTTVKGEAFPYYALTGQSVVLANEWKLTFVDGGPVLPAARTTSKLISWTDMGDEELKRFSGTAEYRTSFAKPGFNASGYLLDLGIVSESAEVILNGSKLQTLIGPSYQLVIPAAKIKDNNTLQVYVTNGMPNRIADLDKRGVEWKKFYNTNFPSRLPQNRDAKGIFTATKWEPKAAGLIGPVTLQGVQPK